jgi:hypothetical protein
MPQRSRYGLQVMMRCVPMWKLAVPGCATAGLSFFLCSVISVVQLEKEGGLCSLQSPNLDPGLFCVVVVDFFEGRAGSQKNRDDGGVGWMRGNGREFGDGVDGMDGVDGVDGMDGMKTVFNYQCLSVSICGSMGRCFASKTLVKKQLVAAMLSCVLRCCSMPLWLNFSFLFHRG